jgi:ABC-type branched-subunit amino acid transport system substrate-binding protein
MKHPRFGALAFASVLLLAVLALSACGGGGSSSDQSTSEGGEGTEGASTAAEGTSTGSEATGSPIKILNDSTVNSPAGSWPGAKAAAETAAWAINAEGGVNGHPIQIVYCNSKQTPNGASACARKAVAEGVVAYTGVGALAPVIYPIIEKAGIAASQMPVGLPEVTSPTNFPITGSGYASQAGAPYAAAQAGAKSIAIVVTEFPGADVVAKAAAKVAEANGVKVLKTIPVAVTASSFGSLAGELAEVNPEAVSFITATPQALGIITASTEIGFQPKVWANSYGAFNPEVIEQLGQVTTSAWMAATLPPAELTDDFPAMATFNEESEAAAEQGVKDTGMELRDENSVFEWLTIHMLAEVAAEIKGEVTAKSMKAALENAKDVDIEGLFKWSPSEPGLKSAPAIKNGGLLYVGPVAGPSFEPETSEPPPVLEEAGF